MRHNRRGTALLVAITLLTLGAALLVGTSAASRSAVRSQVSHEAALRTDAAARRKLAEFVAGWSGVEDSLATGESEQQSDSAQGLLTRVRLTRVSGRRFVVVVEAEVGPAGAVLARRRLQLIMERVPPADSALPPGAPRPIGRWSLSDIY